MGFTVPTYYYQFNSAGVGIGGSGGSGGGGDSDMNGDCISKDRLEDRRDRGNVWEYIPIIALSQKTLKRRTRN